MWYTSRASGRLVGIVIPWCSAIPQDASRDALTRVCSSPPLPIAVTFHPWPTRPVVLVLILRFPSHHLRYSQWAATGIRSMSRSCDPNSFCPPRSLYPMILLFLPRSHSISSTASSSLCSSLYELYSGLDLPLARVKYPVRRGSLHCWSWRIWIVPPQPSLQIFPRPSVFSVATILSPHPSFIRGHVPPAVAVSVVVAGAFSGSGCSLRWRFGCFWWFL